jgi:tRNA A37 threonylcarbamoyladenosine modification protein TsaB
MKILAIESSCDETACAVIEDGVKILGSSIATSVTMHEKYGGIVPEVAAREQLKCVIPVIQEALSASHETIESIDSLAVTVGPGLIGSLLIGVETAKTIAFTTGKPIIPVNHVLAHMYANFLSSQKENSSRAQSRDNPTSPRLRGASKAICLIGKSLIFDSGGLSLKSAEHMIDMKCDIARRFRRAYGIIFNDGSKKIEMARRHT